MINTSLSLQHAVVAIEAKSGTEFNSFSDSVGRIERVRLLDISDHSVIEFTAISSIHQKRS